ncbi:hypothetical protein M9H77_26913 [Catharanthus roseus]|uniref:Uncharacterized protein n=1 Tax=Catharanthus roseus TaxID=4058 RepID=A0ACC0AB82_CATRO|nr:hypothetical protein M9H77_26913 [Catharanthus roseus]
MNVQVLIVFLMYTMSKEGHLPTQSHQEGISVARDVEELKKGKGRATIEQRAEDNLEGVYSPHHQRAYDNVPPYGYDMPIQNSYPFHEIGYQGR